MATTRNPRKPRPRKGKQLRITGMEPVHIPEVTSAAETYHDRKLERCQLSKEEGEAKDNLIDKMKAHGLSRYETPDGLLVEVTDKANVKTRKKGQAEEAE